MKSLCTQNRTRAASCILAVFLIGELFSTAWGASPVVNPEVAAFSATQLPPIGEDDLIALLSLSLGGRDLALVAWSNMNLAEKQTLRDQAERIALAAQAAKREGILASPDVALVIQWGADALLAEELEKKIVSEVDLSEKALRSFYDANLQRYSSSAAVRYRLAVYPLTQKDVALRVKNQLKQAPLSRLKNCVSKDWTEYGKLDPALAAELLAAPIGKVMGSIETREGHVLYEVLERREEGPASFEECADHVREDLIQVSIKEKLQ